MFKHHCDVKGPDPAVCDIQLLTRSESIKAAAKESDENGLTSMEVEQEEETNNSTKMMESEIGGNSESESDVSESSEMEYDEDGVMGSESDEDEKWKT